MATLRKKEPCSFATGSAYRYQVFLSFGGKDTRKTFTAHLHKALKKAGIDTFYDDSKLEKGKNIASGLIKAIEESRFAVVVFSTNYAASKWCLDELVKIAERKKTVGLEVIPVFYDVQPTDVRHQSNSFGEAFSTHQRKVFKSKEKEEEMMHKLEKWREALGEVASLKGMVLQNDANGYEPKFIRKIVKYLEDIIFDTDDDETGSGSDSDSDSDSDS
ncbi:hypothetical protein LguiA_005620 [Lonicera macranthoides]